MKTKQSKYVLTGGPGSGKTTLLNALRDKGNQTIPEVAQLVVKEFLKKGPLPKWDSQNTTEFQKIFLRIHASLESKLKNNTICFFDRSVIDTIAYCRFYNNKPLKELLLLAHTNRFTKVFLLNFLPFYKNTQVRQEPFSVAQELHYLIKETYEEFGYKLIQVPPLSIKARAKFVCDKINEINLQKLVFSKNQHMLNL